MNHRLQMKVLQKQIHLSEMQVICNSLVTCFPLPKWVQRCQTMLTQIWFEGEKKNIYVLLQDVK